MWSREEWSQKRCVVYRSKFWSVEEWGGEEWSQERGVVAGRGMESGGGSAGV